MVADRLWNSYGSEEEGLRLVDFIEPGSDAVGEVIAQAKSKAPNGEFPAYVPPPGWNRSIGNLVNLQVEAIYETLREWGIGYTVERWDSQPPAQVIRTHEEVLSSEGIGGPCIDLVVLMAACLEFVGIQPLVVVLQNREERHAVLGYRLEELICGPETPASELPPLLSERKFRKLKNDGKLEFINCTGITPGDNANFEEALTQGNDYVKYWDLVFALDVKVVRHTARTREMQKYLEQVQTDALTLPPAFGFPPGRKFHEIRVRVKVRKGQRRYSEAEARARETARREGHDEESMTKVYGQFPWTSPADKERETERPLDWDREVRQRLKRAAILGDPGFGKTWLLKHEALKLAEEALKKLEQYPLATDKIKIPILLPLAQLAEQVDDKPIDEALLAALEGRYFLGDRLKAWLGENLNSEKLVLLLDALDELSPEQKEDLCEHLKEFAQKYDRTPILLTSRLVGYPGPPFPLPPEGEFELLAFDRRQQRELVRAWFAGRSEQGDRFLRKLRESPQLHGLAGVPLLLALMCRLFDERDELPKSRAELYAGCVNGILRREWKTPRSGDDPYLDAKLELAEELAFALFTEEKELFSLRDLRETIRKIFEARPNLRDELNGKAAADLVSELEADGLLIKAGAGDDPPFLFLHLTFQEYLTACALARRGDYVEANGEQIPEWLAIVKPHLFDPRWEEVIRLLASQLEDATPLLQAIWDEPEDILFGRLLLAGKCLLDAQPRPVQDTLRKAVIDTTLDLLKKAVRPSHTVASSEERLITMSLEIEDTRAYLARQAGMLAAAFDEVFQELRSMLKLAGKDGKRILIEALGTSQSERVVLELLQALQDPNPGVRVEAVKALGEIGGERAVDGLLQALQDPDPRVRWNAAWALGEIGGERVVPELLQALQGPHLDVRGTVAWALEKIEVRGAVAWALEKIGDERVVPELLQALQNPEPIVRGAAAWALGEIGGERAVNGLLQALQEPNLSVRREAAEALGKIGGERVVPELLQALQDPEPDVRWNAAWALGEIGGERVVPELLQALQDPDHFVRGAAAEALGKIGDERVVPELLQALQDPILSVMEAAARALGEIGDERVVPELLRLLQDPHPGVREAVAWVLGKIGGDRVVPELLQALQDPDVRWTAAMALGKIGDGLAVNGLLQALQDPEPGVRWNAAEALGEIGGERAVNGLLQALQDPDVRWAAAEALGKIGSAEAVPYLVPLLQDRDVRWEAAWALGEIGRKQGIRILLDGSYTKVR